MLERQQRENRFDRARCRKRVSDHRFVGRDRHVLGALAEHRGDAEAFHLVVFRRAGAVGVDVVDFLGFQIGIRDRLADAADDRLAVGTRSRTVERVRALAAAGNDAADLRPARVRCLKAFQHQRAGAFRHHETVAVL